MGLLDIASANSFWRGYDIFEAGKVLSCEKIDDYKYHGRVAGSADEPYEVTIDITHPNRSVCTCPHAEGTRRVCKHKVALYFSVNPEAAVQAIKDAEEWEAEEEQRIKEEYATIEKYVNSLSKQELREQLLWRLIDERERRRW